MARVRGSVGTTRGFLSSVNKWTLDTRERSTQAYRNGALDFYDALAAETPVKTGNLRNSLVAHLNSDGDMAMVTGPGNTSDDSTYRGGAEKSISNIMQAELGDRISYVYHATYARRLEYGFFGADSLGRVYSQAGRFWIARVGSRYRSIMRAAASRLSMRVK